MTLINLRISLMTAAKALVGKGPDKVVGPTIEDAFGPLERRVYDFGL